MTSGAIFCDGEDAWWPGCGTCATCGEVIKPGRSGVRKFWFHRPACAREWRRNHQWQEARGYALRRAGNRCQRDGCLQTKGLQVNHKRALADLAVAAALGAATVEAGVPDFMRLQVAAERVSGVATLYRTGCQHHQDNLEVLCKPHHQEETNRQRIERSAVAAPAATATGGTSDEPH